MEDSLTQFEKHNLTIEWISAFLTFLIIIIAMWGERIRQLWTKPKLKISLNDPQGVLNIRNDRKKARYYLLNVRNDRRSSPAKNVRVLITNILKRSPDNSWKPIKFSGPVHVMWRWPNMVPPYLTIGPEQQSTFGFVIESSHYFELQLYWCPNNLNPKLVPNEPVRLEIQAVSDTTESNTLIIEMAWDGVWEEGSAEMQNHLIVKNIN